MSKIIKCDACGKVIDFSKTQALEHIEVNGVEFAVQIEVLNRYECPKPSPRIGRNPYPVAIPMPITKDDNFDLCPECFSKIITALKAKLNA